MTVPEALRVDTDGGIKPDMAFLALLAAENLNATKVNDFLRRRFLMNWFSHATPLSMFESSAERRMSEGATNCQELNARES
jgi:hypothetical protein